MFAELLRESLISWHFMLVQCVCQKYSLSKRLQSFFLFASWSCTQMSTVRKWDKANGVNVITASYLVQQLEKIFHQTVEEQWFIWSKMVNIRFWSKHLESILWSSLKRLQLDMFQVLWWRWSYFGLGLLTEPGVGKLYRHRFSSICGTLFQSQ